MVAPMAVAMAVATATGDGAAVVAEVGKEKEDVAAPGKAEARRTAAAAVLTAVAACVWALAVDWGVAAMSTLCRP